MLRAGLMGEGGRFFQSLGSKAGSDGSCDGPHERTLGDNKRAPTSQLLSFISLQADFAKDMRVIILFQMWWC
jgi:hypothetical protein